MEEKLIPQFRMWANDCMIPVDEIVWSLNGEIRSISYWESEVKKITFRSDECILMQYTGINDKNGRMIYQRDIIKDEKGKEYVVLRVPGGWGVYIFPYDEIFYEGLSDRQTKDWAENCEVIGNLFEGRKLWRKL